MLRLWSLIVKEFIQLKRNRRLVVILILPPTLNIVLFGFALNPEVKDLRLGVVDCSRTPESRELVSAFTESNSFLITGYFNSTELLAQELSRGHLTAGLVIPEDYARNRARRQTAQVQLLIDAVDSNTASIAGGYAARIVGAYNQRLANVQPEIAPPAGAPVARLRLGGPAIERARIRTAVSLFYNAGLQNSWFIVTGMIGTLLVMQGSLVAAASMVKEKEAGTIEQLLMTPAETSEIILAKMAPILLLLSLDIFLALGVTRAVFGVPVRGHLALLFLSGVLCVMSGIGIGTLIATFSRSQQQAQLLGFFVNPPLSLLSGATMPIEAMPQWLQPITLVNPIRHFATIARGVMLKGTGLETLYPNLLALACFTLIVVGISWWRFRKQLA